MARREGQDRSFASDADYAEGFHESDAARYAREQAVNSNIQRKIERQKQAMDIIRTNSGTRYVIFGDNQRMYELLEGVDPINKNKHNFELRVKNDPNNTYVNFSTVEPQGVDDRTLFEHAFKQSDFIMDQQINGTVKTAPHATAKIDGMRHLRSCVQDAVRQYDPYYVPGRNQAMKVTVTNPPVNGIYRSISFGDGKRMYELGEDVDPNNANKHDFKLFIKGEPENTYARFSTCELKGVDDKTLFEHALKKADIVMDQKIREFGRAVPHATATIEGMRHLRSCVQDAARQYDPNYVPSAKYKLEDVGYVDRTMFGNGTEKYELVTSPDYDHENRQNYAFRINNDTCASFTLDLPDRDDRFPDGLLYEGLRQVEKIYANTINDIKQRDGGEDSAAITRYEKMLESVHEQAARHAEHDVPISSLTKSARNMTDRGMFGKEQDYGNTLAGRKSRMTEYDRGMLGKPQKYVIPPVTTSSYEPDGKPNPYWTMDAKTRDADVRFVLEHGYTVDDRNEVCARADVFGMESLEEDEQRLVNIQSGKVFDYIDQIGGSLSHEDSTKVDTGRYLKVAFQDGPTSQGYRDGYDRSTHTPVDAHVVYESVPSGDSHEFWVLDGKKSEINVKICDDKHYRVLGELVGPDAEKYQARRDEIARTFQKNEANTDKLMQDGKTNMPGYKAMMDYRNGQDGNDKNDHLEGDRDGDVVDY